MTGAPRILAQGKRAVSKEAKARPRSDTENSFYRENVLSWLREYALRVTTFLDWEHLNGNLEKQ